MAKRGYISEGDLAEVCSIRSPQVEKRLVDSRLLLLFHDVVLVGREQHPPTTARAGYCKRTSFRCCCPLARACNIIIFVRFSAENLTL